MRSILPVAALALVFALPSAASAAAPPAIQTTASGSVIEADFAEPTPGHRDPTITKRVKQMIGAARGEVLVGLHSLSLPGVADALVKADARDDVIVRVVDNRNDKGGRRALAGRKKLGANYRRCGTDSQHAACISAADSSLMHSKYMLFSSTVDAQGRRFSNVTWFGSANMTAQTGQKTDNDAVTVFNDAELYGKFRAGIWQPMWNGTRAADFFNPPSSGYFVSKTSDVTAYASPQAPGQFDFVAKALSHVAKTTPCTVSVMQNMIHSRTGVLDQLVRLATLTAKQQRDGKHACTVRVVVGMKGDEAHPGKPHISCNAFKRLNRANIPVHLAKVHDKLFITTSDYKGAYKALVFTGSHNISKSALNKNDELFVKLNAGGPLTPVFQAYARHFGQAFRAGHAPKKLKVHRGDVCRG